MAPLLAGPPLGHCPKAQRRERGLPTNAGIIVTPYRDRVPVLNGDEGNPPSERTAKPSPIGRIAPRLTPLSRPPLTTSLPAEAARRMEQVCPPEAWIHLVSSRQGTTQGRSWPWASMMTDMDTSRSVAVKRREPPETLQGGQRFFSVHTYCGLASGRWHVDVLLRCWNVRGRTQDTGDQAADFAGLVERRSASGVGGSVAAGLTGVLPRRRIKASSCVSFRSEQ